MNMTWYFFIVKSVKWNIQISNIKKVLTLISELTFSSEKNPC